MNFFFFRTKDHNCFAMKISQLTFLLLRYLVKMGMAWRKKLGFNSDKKRAHKHEKILSVWLRLSCRETRCCLSQTHTDL